MATSIIEKNKKCCIKCEGTKCGGGLFTCDGCQQMFCGRHVGEHRQELSIQLDNTMQEHDLVQQESNQFTLDQTILNKIDMWARESIIKIQKTAETLRSDFHQLQQGTSDQIKIECAELGKNLLSARETDDFSEPDLLQWNQLLTNLRKRLESMTKTNIIEDKQSSISLIKVQQHQNHYWLIDMTLEQASNFIPKSYINNASNRSNIYQQGNYDTQLSSRSTRQQQ